MQLNKNCYFVFIGSDEYKFTDLDKLCVLSHYLIDPDLKITILTNEVAKLQSIFKSYPIAFEEIIPDPSYGFVAHQADNLRLKKLSETGGFSSDIDNFIVRPIVPHLKDSILNAFKEEWYELPNKGIYSSIGFLYSSEPQNAQVNAWLKGYDEYDRTSWTKNSTRYPSIAGFQKDMNLLEMDGYIPHFNDEIENSIFHNLEFYLAKNPFILSFAKSLNLDKTYESKYLHTILLEHLIAGGVSRLPTEPVV